MIDFNRAPFTGKETEYMEQAIKSGKMCGDGPFTKKCAKWICDTYHVNHTLLTTSCTHALEMSAYLADIQPGDEVIMPSLHLLLDGGRLCAARAKIVLSTSVRIP